MIRTLLTTTALVGLLATGAIAQDAAAPAAAPAATDTAASTSSQAAGAMDISAGYTATPTDNRASDIIGMPVYSGTQDDAENIGDVNDLIVNEGGEVVAVVIGVGGFLGIGEKNVAVQYSDVQWTTAQDNSERLVLPTTKDALNSAPAFEWPDDNNDNAAANDTNAMTPAADATAMAPAGSTNATDTATPAGTMAPADNAAMAPADNAMAPAGDAMAPVANTEIDRSSMQNVDRSTLTADDLEGTAVYGSDNEQIGTIGDIVLGTDNAAIDAVIVDVGGFLGIGTKPVAIGFDTLQFSVDPNGNRFLFLNTTKDQLNNQPAFNKDTYTTERDTQRMMATQ